MHIVLKLIDPSLFIDKCFVDGDYVSAMSGSTFEVKDPATGKVIGKCPGFNAQDTYKVVTAAENAFLSFRKTVRRERATMLRKWYDLVIQNAENWQS